MFLKTQILGSLRLLISEKGFQAISTLVRKMCENIITPPFHFYHLPIQVPKCLFCLKDSGPAIIFAIFLGGLAPRDPFFSLKKAQKNEVSCLSPF